MVQKLWQKTQKCKKSGCLFLYKIAKKRRNQNTFCFFAKTHEPIITKACEAPLNDCHNLSFVKDENSYGEKMARKIRTKAIYKVNFISEHTLA